MHIQIEGLSNEQTVSAQRQSAPRNMVLIIAINRILGHRMEDELVHWVLVDGLPAKSSRPAGMQNHNCSFDFGQMRGCPLFWTRWPWTALGGTSIPSHSIGGSLSKTKERIYLCELFAGSVEFEAQKQRQIQAYLLLPRLS